MSKLTHTLLFPVLVFIATPILAADLTIWWEKGYYPEEDTAIEKVVAAYKQKSSKDVALSLLDQSDFAPKTLAALKAGQPPDVAFGRFLGDYIPKWALDDVLTDLSDVIEPIKDQFAPGVLEKVLLPNNRAEQKAYYALPFGQQSAYIHVWTSLLEQAGIKLGDIPKEWDAFWTFWCDTAQPAVRKAMGRNDIYGAGLPMSAEASDTETGLSQFMNAYGVDYITDDGKLLLDDPAVRQKIVKAMSEYTAVFRKGCVPPDSVSWKNPDNNKNFHDQKILMTVNSTLSIPAALRFKRPDDYFKNTATIPWPKGPDGNSYPLDTGLTRIVILKQAKNIEGAKDFMRFMLSGDGLGPYLEASLGRQLPVMPPLLNASFWQNQADPHVKQAVAQISQSWPVWYININWKIGKVYEQSLWEKAVHRVAAEGISPEQAVDDVIAQIKKILSE